MKKIAIFLIMISIYAVIPYINTVDGNTDINIDITEENSELYRVVRVVDGDTIVININNIDEYVRLIGVDCPESVHPDSTRNTELGDLSSAFTKRFLEGEYVSLELDVQEKDKYGRILAYVYIDDIMFNKILLAAGMAQVATFPPNVKYVNEFQRIQQDAIENNAGLWGLWE
jgi:micrococcal nuclease